VPIGNANGDGSESWQPSCLSHISTPEISTFADAIVLPDVRDALVRPG